MQDSEIVAAIIAGDAEGLAAAYDRYAAPLLAFCSVLLAERADSSDAVQDTFVVATAELDGLRDPEQLRPWLYAVARNECHRRLRARAQAAGLDDGAATAMGDDDTIDFGVDLERAELREVVRAGLAALGPTDREVVEMSIRQDFGDEELAAVLGVSRTQAHQLAGRAKQQFAGSLGALLVVRGGRSYCDKLDVLLDGWDGSMTVLLRKRISRHVRTCRSCADRKRHELPAAMLLSVLAAVGIARGLRPQVLDLAAATAPEAIAYRAGVVRRAAPFGETGFPVPLDPPQVVHRARRPVVVVGAAAVFAGLCAFAFEAGLLQHHGPPAQAAASLGSQVVAPGTGTSSTSTVTTSGKTHRSSSKPAADISATPTISPTGTLTVTPGGGTGPTSPGSHSSSPTSPSSPPHTSPPPSSQAGTLTASPGSVTLGESAQGGDPTGSFTLTANGGPVNYSISAPSGYAEDLIISPSSGSLAEGESITITVTWESSSTMSGGLAIGPNNPGVTVSYEAPSPVPSPSPTQTASTEP